MTDQKSDLEQLAKAWRTGIDLHLPDAIDLRHELHANPDVSGAEEPTALRVVEAILAGDGAGVSIQTVADTGRLLRFGPAGAAIGLRSELDALPMRELTGAPFAATNGAMHACGHDVHLAALVAVLKAARTLDLPAGMVAILQPREEVGPTGAIDIVNAGDLLPHDLRGLVAAHVQPQVAAGHVSADAGAVNAAVDEVEITITGKGGHGAYPQLAIDPVPALCMVVLALQEAARSAVDPMHPVVVTMTQLEGSGAPNVIPGTAHAAGTIRAMSDGDRELLHERISRTVTSIAAAHGCRGEYVVRRGEPALVNDAALAAGTARWLADFGIPTASFASCGSDDFANYGLQVPILMQFVGTGEGSAGPMLHDAHYLPGDHVVRQVALAMVAGWLAGAQTLLAGRFVGADS